MIAGFLFWIIKDCLFLLGCLSGRQSFPKPLNAQEEREALLAMQAGDEAARTKLIEHNMRLIVHIARKYKVPGCAFDDLISIGSIGLIKAVRSYDMSSGTSLSTNAARCIENEILMSLRHSRKQQNDVSLDEPLGTDSEGNSVSFSDLLGTPPDLVENEVRRRVTLEKVRKALPALPPRERMVLSMRYGLSDGVVHPQHEIAKRLDISRSYVSRSWYCKRCPKAGKEPSGIGVLLSKSGHSSVPEGRIAFFDLFDDSFEHDFPVFHIKVTIIPCSHPFIIKNGLIGLTVLIYLFNQFFQLRPMHIINNSATCTSHNLRITLALPFSHRLNRHQFQKLW